MKELRERAREWLKKREPGFLYDLKREEDMAAFAEEAVADLVADFVSTLQKQKERCRLLEVHEQELVKLVRDQKERIEGYQAADKIFSETFEEGGDPEAAYIRELKRQLEELQTEGELRRALEQKNIGELRKENERLQIELETAKANLLTERSGGVVETMQRAVEEALGRQVAAEEEVKRLRKENERLHFIRAKSCSCICHEDGEALFEENERLKAQLAALPRAYAEDGERDE